MPPISHTSPLENEASVVQFCEVIWAFKAQMTISAQGQRT